MSTPLFTDLTGLASIASATAALVSRLSGIARLTKSQRILLLGTAFVLMLVPFGEMPLATYVRGATGDLSVTSLVLLWCAILRPWSGCLADDSKNRIALLALISIFAFGLYPMALGMSVYDPYRMGYGSLVFIILLLILAITAWLRESVLIVLCISLATLAWAVGWYESNNLWDYLLDPFVAVYSLAMVIRYGAKMLLGFLQNGPANRSIG